MSEEQAKYGINGLGSLIYAFLRKTGKTIDDYNSTEEVLKDFCNYIKDKVIVIPDDLRWGSVKGQIQAGKTVFVEITETRKMG